MARTHPASRILTKTEHETQINIKSNTPYVSAVKRINKALDKFDLSPTNKQKKYRQGEYKKVTHIKLRGMGKAISSTISLALHYRSEKGYSVDIYTGTTEVLDKVEVAGQEAVETKDGESEQVSKLQKRSVSFVEVKIWLKRR